MKKKPMTAKQFELLARMLRSKDPVTTAAKMVLLQGITNAEAARATDVKPQSVHRSVKRFVELHEEVSKLYPAS